MPCSENGFNTSSKEPGTFGVVINNDVLSIPDGSTFCFPNMIKRVSLCGLSSIFLAIARNIEDNPHNETRFIILGKQKVDPSGIDKTSLLITTPNVPGSLLEVLKPFSEQGINISQITSRPYRHKQWSYL